MISISQEGHGDPPLYYVSQKPRRPAPESDEEVDGDSDSDPTLNSAQGEPEAPANILPTSTDLPGHPSVEVAS